VVGADEEGDVPSYTLNMAPANGTVAIDAVTGAYVYTPRPDFNGTDSFLVTMDDGNGGVTVARVDINVTAVPDAVDDAATTPAGTPVAIAVLGNDSFEDPGRAVSGVNGQALAVGQSVAVANGTVTLNADGTLLFTPDAGFVGLTRFTYTVTSGGVTETATVTVIVGAPVGEPERPAPPDVPVAQDFPFVFAPSPEPAREPDRAPPAYLEPYADPYRDAFYRPRPFADAKGLVAEPAVVIAVNGQNWLGGTPSIVGASGVVLQAVDGVASLGGLNTLTSRGIVVAAVDDLQPLGSIDTRDAGHKGDWLRARTAPSLEAAPGRIASLNLGNDVQLEMTQQGERVWIEALGNVRELRATLAGGGAVPPWVHVDRRGFVAIDRPADSERLRLRIIVVPQRGATRSQVIEFDFNSGQMHNVDGSRRDQGRMGGGRASVHGPGMASVPDFGTQLERAASRPLAQDAQLLEALGRV